MFGPGIPPSGCPSCAALRKARDEQDAEIKRLSKLVGSNRLMMANRVRAAEAERDDALAKAEQTLAAYRGIASDLLRKRDAAEADVLNLRHRCDTWKNECLRVARELEAAKDAAEADVLRLQAENDKLKTLLRLAEVALSLDDEPEPQTFSTGGAPSPAPHTFVQHGGATFCSTCRLPASGDWSTPCVAPSPAPSEDVGARFKRLTGWEGDFEPAPPIPAPSPAEEPQP